MSGARRPRWSAEHDALLKAPAKPLPVLASEIGRSLAAVHKRRSELGFTKSPPPPHRQAAPQSPPAPRPPRVRSFASKGYVEPQALAEREPKTRRRACLSCREPFDTTRFIFVCDGCKHTESWRTAL